MLIISYLCAVLMNAAMMKGKSICKVLKTIRKQVADANDIKYEPRECHHQGDCRGTCPACEAEVKYIEQQLDLRKQLGKAVAVVGISAGLAALTGCKNKNAAIINEEDSSLTVGKATIVPSEHIDGDVEYQSPVDTAIIEKDSSKIKKRTAEFAVPEKEDSYVETLGEVCVIEEPGPVITDPVIADAPMAKIGETVDQMPSFPGGENKMLEYLESNLRYPVLAEENGIQGRVVVSFIIEKDGSINDVKVEKHIEKVFDKESVRLVKNMPKWNPGKKDGEPVRVRHSIPIMFRLK